jgi:hypothetical protein
MTYKNKVVALSSSLACLLLIYAAGIIFSPDRLRDRAESGKLLAGKSADAALVSISSGSGSPLDFKKVSGTWTLEEDGASLPVQSSRVEALLSSLAEVKSLSLRSSSKSSWNDFSLDETRGKRVVVKNAAGKSIADFYAGSYGPTGSEIYVRLAGKDSVYAAAGDFGTYVEGGRASWLSRALFNDGPKPEDVQSLDYGSSLDLSGATKAKAKTVAWSAVRSGGTWTVKAAASSGASNGAAVTGETVDAVLRSALSLEGDDMKAVVPPEAFAKTQASIVMHLGSGKSVSFEVGGSAADGLFYARCSSSPYVYEVSRYSLANVLR